MTIKLPPLWQQCLIFWAVLCLTIIGYTDTLPALLGISDYLMTFHTAGYVASHGLWGMLYPPADCVSFASAPFDKLAHSILPSMPASSVGEYMYMPTSAFVFAPFSLLAPTLSMIAWQLTSLLATMLGITLCLKTTEGPGRHKILALVALGAAFAFLPFTMTIWIGQVGLVFGLLPLAAGFYFLRREKPLAAGLVFSLLCLKPQMLTPALFLIAFELARKNWRVAAGLASGAFALALANWLGMGGTLCKSWLACLALSDKIYSDAGHGVAVHLATSMPRAILLSQPLTNHGLAKPLVYAAAALLLAAGLFAAAKIARSPLIKRENGLILAFALGGLALPVVVPHLFIYDLGALVPTALLLLRQNSFADGLEASICRQLKTIVWLFIASIDIYCLFLVIDKGLAQPLILVAIMLLCYVFALTSMIVGKKPIN